MKQNHLELARSHHVPLQSHKASTVDLFYATENQSHELDSRPFIRLLLSTGVSLLSFSCFQEHGQSRSQSLSLSVLSRGASGGSCHFPAFTAAPVHRALRLSLGKGSILPILPAVPSVCKGSILPAGFQCGQRQASCLQFPVCAKAASCLQFPAWADTNILPAVPSLGRGSILLAVPSCFIAFFINSKALCQYLLQAKAIHRLQVCREQAYPYHQPQLKTDKAV